MYAGATPANRKPLSGKKKSRLSKKAPERNQDYNKRNKEGHDNERNLKVQAALAKQNGM